jgi:hypothetical protein
MSIKPSTAIAVQLVLLEYIMNLGSLIQHNSDVIPNGGAWALMIKIVLIPAFVMPLFCCSALFAYALAWTRSACFVVTSTVIQRAMPTGGRSPDKEAGTVLGGENYEF